MKQHLLHWSKSAKNVHYLNCQIVRQPNLYGLQYQLLVCSAGVYLERMCILARYMYHRQLRVNTLHVIKPHHIFNNYLIIIYISLT